MPLIAILVAALAIGFEQLVQWKYGPMGIIAFLALSIGIKAKNSVIGGIGAVILVMLSPSRADRAPFRRGAGSSVGQHQEHSHN
jgi:4-amino-4-deoxy-L-arabinose transferase-like glycosyltransferase